jgi:hypothetical protein
MLFKTGFGDRGRCAALASFLVSGLTALAPFSALALSSVNLAWTPSTGTNIAGYHVYYGAASRTYTNMVFIGNATNTTISGLMDGVTYYFAATAADTSGLESDYSNEASNAPAAIANQPPTLNSLSNLTINENAALQIVNLSGVTSGASDEIQTLTVTATSSHPDLIPNPTVNYTSPDTTGTLTFTPVASAFGSATITVTVNDGGASNNVLSRSFAVTVNAVNQAPTISAISDQTTAQDTPTAPVPFTVGDVETVASNLTLCASCANTALIATNNIVFGGSDSNRTVTLTPLAGQNGDADITIMVSDGTATASATFRLTVAASRPTPNTPPTISPIANLTINQSTATPPLPFTVGDGETAASNLTVCASSANLILVPTNNIVLGGSDSNRTVTVTPVPGQTGSANITITVGDGIATTNTTFQLTVQSTPPTLVIRQYGRGRVSPDLTAQTLRVGRIYTVTAIPDPGQAFAGWSGSITSSTPRISFVMKSNVVLVVCFAPLTLTTSGIGTISPDLRLSQSLIAGRTYTTTAVPGPGQVFAGWTGMTNSSAQSLRFTMTTNVVLQANFLPVTLITNGIGTISPDLRLSRYLTVGTACAITAVPGPGQVFAGWTGMTNSSAQTVRFTMTTNVVLQANFLPVRLTTDGIGTISPDLRLSRYLTVGTAYTITAVPGPGQVFAGWTGMTNSLTQTLRFVMRTNVVLQAKFIPSPFIPVQGSYNGLFHEDDAVRPNSAGFFTASVSARGSYSGSLQLGTNRFAFAGQLDLQLQATNVIRLSATNALSLQLRVGGADQLDQISGRLTDGFWVSTLSGDRAGFNSRTNPAPYAGSYTLILPGQDGDPSLPRGDGFGTVQVSSNGLATFAGTLADGTAVSQSAPLSRQGLWPLYVPLYSGRGSLLSWLAFTNQPNDDFHGLLSWIKPANPAARCYPDGFTNLCQALGSAYRRPATSTNHVLNLTNAYLVFSGGNLVADFTNSVALGLNSQITNLSSNQLTLSFSLFTGTFKGSATDPATGKALPFSGAVFQKQNAAYGFLLGTNQSSRVSLTP